MIHFEINSEARIFKFQFNRYHFSIVIIFSIDCALATCQAFFSSKDIVHHNILNVQNLLDIRVTQELRKTEASLLPTIRNKFLDDLIFRFWKRFIFEDRGPRHQNFFVQIKLQTENIDVNFQ